MSDWNTRVIDEFRANDGRVAQFGDAPMVVLSTIGAKTGKLREIPLVTLVEGDDMFVFASKAGAPTNPDWYYNLKAHPEINVEYGAESFTARLEELPEAEGQEVLRRQAEVMPQFAGYIESAAPRVIPVFAIRRL